MDSNTIGEKSNIAGAEEGPIVSIKKTCTNCGKEMDDDVVFCTGCGQKVEETTEEPEVEEEEFIPEESQQISEFPWDDV